jgi:hypothetical protein
MKTTKQKISTNNFLISKKIDLTGLEGKFRVLKYTLSEAQNNFRKFADKNFYARFTNNYKENFDIPFYYHLHTGLYALAPKEGVAKKWLYTFSEQEEIAVSEIAFDELELHILMKLFVALFFYNESDQQRRVCQSKFFAVGKGKGNKLVALQFELKQIKEDDEFTEFHIKSGALNFIKKDRSKINPQYVSTDTYFELLIKEGMTYLRQLRPSKVLNFSGDIYTNNIPFKMERARLDWYSDSKYRETKSFLVHTFKERFKAFLSGYSVQIIEKEQEFMRLERNENSYLPVDLLDTIKVYDNRLSRNIPIDRYVSLFNSLCENKVRFEITQLADDANRLLVVHDCQAKDFSRDDSDKGILSEGHTDPYKDLYLKFPDISKQSIVVNPQDGADFENPINYLDYGFLEDSELELFKTKLEVCLNELLLKSILYGQFEPSKVLPFLNDNPQIFEWGFISNKTLMHFVDGKLMFADLSTRAGKETLATKFMRWSELLNVFKSRKPFLLDEELEDHISKSVFIVNGNSIIEIERLDEAVLPEISKITEAKADDPTKSARGRDAITVYSGGVWFNEKESTYVVSGAHSMNWREPRAHHIYKIHQYQPENVIQLVTVVKLLCVKFVRNKQFTVYPYFFDLLRLNAELKGIVAQAN